MTAATSQTPPSDARGPLTLAVERLGRLLHVNVQVRRRGPQVVVAILTNPPAVMASPVECTTLEESAANAANWLNHLSDAHERALRAKPGARAQEQRPSALEQKPRVMPGARKIG